MIGFLFVAKYLLGLASDLLNVIHFFYSRNSVVVLSFQLAVEVDAVALMQYSRNDLMPRLMINIGLIM
jgi:hypothetical protein